METPTVALSAALKAGLDLFNSVVVGDPERMDVLKLQQTLSHGYVLDPHAATHPAIDSIIQYLNDQSLSGQQINKTFYASWETVMTKSRLEIAIDQILHYMTTYGFQELGIFSADTVYIPGSAVDIPEIKSIPLKVIHGIGKEEMIQKCLGILQSGIALTEETVDSVLLILRSLEYTFTPEGLNNLKNKEALIKICESQGVFPSDPVEFLRFLLYRAINQTLLIKDDRTIDAIKDSGLDISGYMTTERKEALSSIFLRFKPLFLAFKRSHVNNKAVINRLRKLAVKNHQPMKQDVLNNVTNTKFDGASLVRAMDKANNFRLIRLLYALNLRLSGSTARVYRIRNGRVKLDRVDAITPTVMAYYQQVYNFVKEYLVERLKKDLDGKTIMVTPSVDYALPATEKMFIGNIPTGTRFKLGTHGIVGIHWRNEWGASDLDLKAIGFNTQIGWNSDWRNSNGSLAYSGDLTDATNGATELMYASNGLREPMLIVNNIFRGEVGCKMQLFIAKEPIPHLNRGHMCDPNNVIAQFDTTMDSRQESLGIMLPGKDGVDFVLAKFSGGGNHVAGYGREADIVREYMAANYLTPIYMNELLKRAGARLVTEADIDVDPNIEIDYDLTVQNMQKDSLLKILS